MSVDVDFKDASSDQTKSTSMVNEFLADLLSRNPIVRTHSGARTASFDGCLGHRVMQWQLTTAYAQWQAKRDGLFHGDPFVIKIAGGWQALAREHLRDTGRGAGAEVEQFIEAQAFAEWKFADGSRGNMILLVVTPRRRNQDASIEIRLGCCLREWWT
jgi:hypothetical protein